MKHESLLVVGAGGHGKVVIDAIGNSKSWFQIIVTDDDASKYGRIILGHKVIGPVTAALQSRVVAFHVAIGHNGFRERITNDLDSHGLASTSIVHIRAYIAESAQIHAGVFIAAQAVVGPDVQLERGCIINHGAVVDHDCHVGEFSHIAPNATLAGAVHVGRRVLIGAGANILPGVSIGDDCTVGAGAVVLNDLEPGCVQVGVPARKKQISEKLSD